LTGEGVEEEEERGGRKGMSRSRKERKGEKAGK
jgi:hypothetical protein